MRRASASDMCSFQALCSQCSLTTRPPLRQVVASKNRFEVCDSIESQLGHWHSCSSQKPFPPPSHGASCLNSSASYVD